MRRAIIVIFSIFLSGLSCAQAAGPTAREPYGIALEGFAYPYPVAPAAACERRRAGPDGLYGRRARATERANRGAAARAEYSVELLGAGHQDAKRCRVSRGGAGSDRLRQVVQAAGRPAFRHAGAQHDHAARSSGRSRKPISWRIRSAACSASGSRAPIPTGSRIWC